jgi:hypothetical protein
MKVKVVAMLGIVLGMSAIFLVSCSPAGSSGFKPGKWTMTMTTVIEGNSPEAQQAREAAKQMQNMPAPARALMQKMQGGMGVSVETDAQGNMVTTVTQCLTDENPVPDAKMPKTCKQTHSVRGNTVTYQTSCKDRNFEAETKGKMTYKGDAMKGESRTHQVVQGKAMDTLVRIDGKYLGPCK